MRLSQLRRGFFGGFSGGLGLATLSGCLWFLACTPFDWSAAGWIASVPMLAAIDRAPTFRRALFLGWWAGVVETGGGFYWLIDTTQRFAGFPWIAGLAVLVAFCAVRALIFLLFTAIVCGIRRRIAVPMTLLAPLGMAACEFLVPQIFPCGQWITQAWQPLVIQIAEITGPWGVTALLMAVNGAIYDLCINPRAARIPALAAAAVVAASLVFGAVRMRQVDELVAHAPRLKVGLVQPNIAYSNDPDFSPEEASRELDVLQEESRRLEAQGAALVVWSEGSYPVALPREMSIDFPPDSAAMIRRGLSGPVLIGADTYDSATADVYNSAILLDRQGAITGLYDKVQLLAFGEYIPGLALFPWLKHIVPLGSARFTAGNGPHVLKFRDASGIEWALGPVICYEDILPEYLVQVGRAHPNLLVNLTVDSWYGARTEPWEHLALAVFASVELREAMVRAVNSGISALIDPNGRLVVETPADDPYRDPLPPEGIVVSAPRLETGRTLFVRFGCWFPYACTLALAALGAVALKRRRAATSFGR
ncbi:MAG TPA: apolipoprotein N-acyltransferase [Steroidobacteraceae bacterium]|jgi:apolipoprotein N-acyltransferase|nr:apolipoprotein N-acyltransferase [Steroidobacteraceae bacterium]